MDPTIHTNRHMTICFKRRLFLAAVAICLWFGSNSAAHAESTRFQPAFSVTTAFALPIDEVLSQKIAAGEPINTLYRDCDALIGTDAIDCYLVNSQLRVIVVRKFLSLQQQIKHDQNTIADITAKVIGIEQQLFTDKTHVRQLTEQTESLMMRLHDIQNRVLQTENTLAHMLTQRGEHEKTVTANQKALDTLLKDQTIRHIINIPLD